MLVQVSAHDFKFFNLLYPVELERWRERTSARIDLPSSFFRYEINEINYGASFQHCSNKTFCHKIHNAKKII